MTIQHRRPVICYHCGLSLGVVETTMGPAGMKVFRAEAARLKKQHECGKSNEIKAESL